MWSAVRVTTVFLFLAGVASADWEVTTPEADETIASGHSIGCIGTADNVTFVFVELWAEINGTWTKIQGPFGAAAYGSGTEKTWYYTFGAGEPGADHKVRLKDPQGNHKAWSGVFHVSN